MTIPTIYKVKGKILCRAENIGQAAMIFSNYFRDLAIRISRNDNFAFKIKLLPESRFTIGPEKQFDDTHKYGFENIDKYQIEIKNKNGCIIGTIEYDPQKHHHYFMAKKKEKILIGDLIDIMNKIYEKDKL